MPLVQVGALRLFHEVAGSGEPVLMLMGLGGDHHGWDLVRGDLVRNHRLVLLDNRDAGASGEASAPYQLADMAADALAVMDRLDVARFHLMGASMGGAIAQRIALAAPERVASLALVSTWGRTDAFLAAIHRSWLQLAATLDPEVFLSVQAPWAFTSHFFASPPPAVVALQEGFRARGALRSVPAYQRQVDACLGHDALPALAAVRAPTLVLVGEEDILTPPRHAHELTAAIPGARLASLPATGHACFLESAPAVGRTLAEFLGAHRVRA